MNYLCHARDFLDRPWALAGAVLPDWTRITAPAARIRPWMVPSPPRSDLEEGLARHFEDDRWFHGTGAFRDVSGAIAARMRERHPDRPARRMRASFFAHLLLEMLLDGWLLEVRPDAAERFARSVRALDPRALATEVERIVPRPVHGLPALLARFGDPRVLRGYASDGEVTRRLGLMGARVRQPPLPEGFEVLTAWARGIVRERAGALLAHPLH